MIRIGLLGGGSWGLNLLRNLLEFPDIEMAGVVDPDAGSRERIAKRFRDVPVLADADALRERKPDAVVVATPADTHAAVALPFLESGVHVMVEKPLATTTADAERLVAAAKKAGVVLMAGHTFLFNAAVRYVRDRIRAGDLGRILYLYGRRLNLGRVREDVDVVWNLAPHDVSIACYLLDAFPEGVSARGLDLLGRGRADVAFLDLDFPGGVTFHVHLSWLDPSKVRETVVVGTDRMLVYDDTAPDEKVRIYEKGIDLRGQPFHSFGDHQLLLRSGDLHVPRIDFPEPLRGQCAHFLECVREGKEPLTGPDHALGVVRVLAAAEESARTGGRVALQAGPPAGEGGV